jgi:hypothetical protein
LVVVPFAGAVVEQGFYDSNALGVDFAEVGSFGEELADQAIGVLVGSALPGFVRLGVASRPILLASVATEQ